MYSAGLDNGSLNAFIILYRTFWRFEWVGGEIIKLYFKSFEGKDSWGRDEHLSQKSELGERKRERKNKQNALMNGRTQNNRMNEWIRQ